MDRYSRNNLHDIDDRLNRKAVLNKLEAKSGGKKDRFSRYYWLIGIGALFLVWQIGAMRLDSQLLLPTPWSAIAALFKAIVDPDVLKDLAITLRRVLAGFSIATGLGLVLGYLMGYSLKFMKSMDPLISSLRQIPLMAWVPLSIFWFGLGDGPTVFLIAMAGLFPMTLAVVTGVQDISHEYYDAARSLGAGTASLLKNVVIPGSIPSIMTGMRLAMSAGWMSVIWAEFIATQSGFGHSLVLAQTRMDTPRVLGLMILAGLVGFAIDRGFLLITRVIARWKYV